MKGLPAILADMRISYVNIFDRLFSVSSDGFHREHPFLLKLLEKSARKATSLYHLPRAAYRALCHYYVQFCRRWTHEVPRCENRHSSNRRGNHPVPHLLKNDLPTAPRSERNTSLRRRAVHCASSHSSSGGTFGLSGRDDLYPSRAEQSGDDRSHFDGLDGDSDRSTSLHFSQENFGREGNHGSRALDGTCLSSDLNSDVSERSQWIYGSQSYALTVSYFGLPYYGWQKTKSGPSVQEELEKALSKILHEDILCEAASRTDRGVHANGQIVQFYTDKTPPVLLQRALNGTLPKTIKVHEIKAVPLNFHPTLDAKCKTYHYTLCFGQDQDLFHRHTSWHYPHSLELEKMKLAAAMRIGTFDFTAYTTKPPKNPICTLSKIEFTLLGENRLQIAITGDRFLYKMARRLSGTLADIGAGKIGLEEIGVTAPSHGLSLYKIYYC